MKALCPTSLLRGICITLAFVFSPLSVAQESLWPLPVDERWYGDTAEGQTSYCQERSIRWDIPFVADMNLDGVNDFIMTVGCYQGGADPGQKHNTPVWGAWRAYCSNDQGGHDDCTERLFGATEILTTGAIPDGLEDNPNVRKPGGGNPYTHVAEEPKDINADGYPDFWYALNRDDGREGFDFEQDAGLLTEFCGERPSAPADIDWDCTRKSVQTMLMSRADGTYSVIELPWGEVNAQAMLLLPNAIGTFDAWAMIYGTHKVARYNNESRTFSDVTEEFEALPNWTEVTYGDPYAKSFELNGAHYIARAEIHPSIVEPPAPQHVLSSHGFTLWKYDPLAVNPAGRFTVSDTYTPAASDIFDYQYRQGTEVVDKKGVVLRGLPTFEPRWHFFDIAVIDSTEEPILIVETESFTQIGSAYGAAIDPNIVYESGGWSSTDTTVAYFAADPIQSFYIRDGKLEERSQSVVEGEAIFGESWKRFWDINGDGLNDLVATSGGAARASIFLNDGTGTMKRLFLGDAFPDLFRDGDYWQVENWLGYGYLAVLLPLSADANQLDLLYYTKGFGWPTIPEYLGDDFVHVAGDINIIRGPSDITSLPFYSVERQQRNLEECFASSYWLDQVKREWCNFGLPATQPDTPTLSVLDAADGAISVRFTGYDGGSAINRYSLVCTANNGEVFSGDSASSVVTLRDLPNEQSYRCVGAVENAVGVSTQSGVTQAIEFTGVSGLPIWLLYEAQKVTVN